MMHKVVATAALVAGFVLPAVHLGSSSPVVLAPRSCHEDTGICWNALLDGNHLGHYIVGVSDAPVGG